MGGGGGGSSGPDLDAGAGRLGCELQAVIEHRLAPTALDQERWQPSQIAEERRGRGRVRIAQVLGGPVVEVVLVLPA